MVVTLHQHATGKITILLIELSLIAIIVFDSYIECKDGVPEEKLCPDGLLFNPATGPQAFPCQYPIDVDCSGRTQTRKCSHFHHLSLLLIN